MTGGSGPRQYQDRDPTWKSLAIYAASPLVAIVMIVGIVFPILIVIIALAAGTVAAVARARPSK
jgi:hypothetical protein